MQGNNERKLEITLIELATAATELAYASVQLGEVQLDQANSEIESIVRKYIRAVLACHPHLIKTPYLIDAIIGGLVQAALGSYCGASFDEFGDANAIELFRKELKVMIAIIMRECTKKRAHLRAIHGVFA